MAAIGPPVLPSPSSSTPSSSSSPSLTTSASPTSSSSASVRTPSNTPSSSSSALISASSTSASSSSSLTSGPSLITSSSSTSSSTTLSATPIVQPTQSQRNTVTRTDVITATPTTSLAAPIVQNTAKSNSFLHNTGAVAGVFTVVGLIALVVLIALTTNAIRRRRAKRFDDDVAQAAAEAAATAHAPIFLDDPEDDNHTYHSLGGAVHSAGGTGGYTTGYSDNSHGTYGQPPMHETYGMSEIHHHPPYDASTGAAGAAGVGTVMQRAKSLKGMHELNTPPGMAGYDANAPGPTPGIGERQTPYPAFAGPAHDAPRYRPAPGNPDFDLLEAAGLGTAAAARPGPPQQAAPSWTDAADASRNRSQGTRSPPADAYYGGAASASARRTSMSPVPASANESYAAHYAPGFRPDVHRAVGEDDAYGGYTDEPQQRAPGSGEGREGTNPFSTPLQGGDGSGSEYSDQEEEPATAKHVVDESRMSFRDEEDYEAERSKRVLKIANE